MKYLQLLSVSLLTLSALSCSNGEPKSDPVIPPEPVSEPEIPRAKEKQSRFLSVDRERFVDAEGRQVILHGLSVISKSKAENYLSRHGPDEFRAMRDWGMNCIRLGIIWDGIEPEPGVYDEKYLDGVSQRIAWAADAGLFVFLDMHQDLFSVKYSDGAPEWATLDEGKPHEKGAIWSDSYLISPAVQAAFDNFWANRPAADGVGLQDHYAAMWAHVAARFADNQTVIAYDIMNEPFEGSSVVEGQRALLQSEFAQRMLERLENKTENPSEKQSSDPDASSGRVAPDGVRMDTSHVQSLATLWMQPEGRALIMAQLEDMELYKAFVDAQEESSQRFEREKLVPMYQRVTNAIRQVDENHILFLEAGYHTNAGVFSGMEPVLGQDGIRDPRQAFAPHAYDIVVDTPQLAHAHTGRVELIFTRHDETAARLGMPMIIGEYGAFGSAGDEILPTARVVMGLFEKLKCGDTYWDFGRNIQDRAYFETLNRPIPLRVAGELVEYRSDPEKLSFTCRWRESGEVNASTVIYLPRRYRDGREIDTGGNVFVETDRSEWGVYLNIAASGNGEEQVLTVRN